MVAPARLEGMLTQQPGIAQAMVHGDREPYIIALIVLESGEAPGVNDLSGTSVVEERVNAAVAAVNRQLTSAERIRRHAVLPAPFTVENGMMTPTLKIRRHAIREHYRELLGALYGAGRPGNA